MFQFPPGYEESFRSIPRSLLGVADSSLLSQRLPLIELMLRLLLAEQLGVYSLPGDPGYVEEKGER